ncbi:hypothetical protein ACQUJV_23710, partial [Ralstonia pseudosolanacearum]
IENLRRNPVCLQRYRHVVARKRQHGLTTTLIYATTPRQCQEFRGLRLRWQEGGGHENGAENRLSHPACRCRVEVAAAIGWHCVAALCRAEPHAVHI